MTRPGATEGKVVSSRTVVCNGGRHWVWEKVSRYENRYEWWEIGPCNCASADEGRSE